MWGGTTCLCGRFDPWCAWSWKRIRDICTRQRWKPDPRRQMWLAAKHQSTYHVLFVWLTAAQTFCFNPNLFSTTGKNGRYWRRQHHNRVGNAIRPKPASTVAWNTITGPQVIPSQGWDSAAFYTVSLEFCKLNDNDTPVSLSILRPVPTMTGQAHQRYIANAVVDSNNRQYLWWHKTPHNRKLYCKR